MKQWWKYALLLTITMFAGRLLACPAKQVSLGGTCRNAEWIQTNLAGGDELLAYGDCLPRLRVRQPDSRCAMWFAEQKSEGGASFTSRIHFLSNQVCTSGETCIGGYSRVARLFLDFGLVKSDTGDLNPEIADITSTGTLYIAAGSAGTNAQPMGSLTWTLGPSSYQSEIKYPDGHTAGGSRNSNETNAFSKSDCDATVTALLAASDETAIGRILSLGLGALDDGRIPVEIHRTTSGLTGLETFQKISDSMQNAVSQTIGAYAESTKLCWRLHELTLP